MENYEWVYFLAIAKENSLTKAAQKLYISQPALSQYLSKLEKRLGIQLYERKRNNSLVLTPAGVRYRQYCEDALRLWNAAKQDMEEKSRESCVTIGVGTRMIQQALSSYYDSIKQDDPVQKVVIRYERAAVMQEKLLSGELQLALGAYSIEHPQLQYRMVSCRELDLIVPKSHPLASRSYRIKGNEKVRVRLSEAGNTPFVILQETTIMRQKMEAYFQQVGFHPQIALEMASTDQTWPYIISGECIGFFPRRFENNQIPENVVPVALDPPVFYTSGAFYRKDFTLTPQLLQIVELYCAKYYNA